MASTQEELRTLGFTGNEAKVYIALLQLEPISCSAIARELGMERTLLYQIMDRLVERGLANYHVSKGVREYRASNPENILNPMEEKIARANEIVQKLRSLAKVQHEHPSVELYEGKEGLRALLKEIIKGRSFCAFGATGRAYDLLYEMPRLSRELSKKGFSARVLVPSNHQTHPFLKIPTIKYKVLDVDSDATTTIFGNRVSIHLATQKPTVIIITNSEVARSYQNHFEILWKAAKNPKL